MISQQQNDIHVNEEETPPSLEQKQPSAPASSGRGWSVWLRVLGVGLPLVCGIAIGAILGPINMLFILSDAWALLIFFFVGIVSACLLRSWWSLLIVPVAFTIVFLANELLFVLGLFLMYGGFDLQQFVAENYVRLDTVVLFVVPIIGAAIGTPIGKMLEKRLRH